MATNPYKPPTTRPATAEPIEQVSLRRALWWCLLFYLGWPAWIAVRFDVPERSSVMGFLYVVQNVWIMIGLWGPAVAIVWWIARSS